MNKYRILVVDDEESLCEILKFNLQREGYEVTTALSAEEVLSMDISADKYHHPEQHYRNWKLYIQLLHLADKYYYPR